MRKERLHTEDVMAMVVGLHYPSAFQRYMIARQKAVTHKIAEANTILERTFGVLLYTEDLISLCALAGIHRKEAKMLRDYEYLSCKQQERLKDEFIGGFQRLGYNRESITRLRDTLLFNEPCDGSSFLIKALFMPYHYLKTVGNWIKSPIFRPLSTSFPIGGR